MIYWFLVYLGGIITGLFLLPRLQQSYQSYMKKLEEQDRERWGR